MKLRPDGKSVAMFGAKEFRVLDNRCWDVARRTADMDKEHVDVQALSPMPELLSYWMECRGRAQGRPPCQRAHLRHDRKGSEAVSSASAWCRCRIRNARPRSFRCCVQVGCRGVEIGSNINGQPPGDPFFDPFFAEAERLGMAVFVHALHPVGTDRVVGPARLVTYLNFPVDTGFAAASMITGRTLEKFPKLRVAFSHGGGTFATILPRLAMGWNGNAELQKIIRRADQDMRDASTTITSSMTSICSAIF